MTDRRDDETELRQALDRAEKLAGRAMALAVSLADLDAIELPPEVDPEIDQAQLRAIASLYLAAELETAGVTPAAEALVGLATTGALQLDLGAATPLAKAFWDGRRDRIAPEERSAFFSRLFGIAVGPSSATAAGDSEFELDMIELCEALYKLDELATNASYGGVAQQVRVRAAASRLVGTIIDASSGITAFLAQEILASLREALALLGHPDLRAALGARDLWAAVGKIDRLARRPQVDHSLHLRRGKAGMLVLTWLAEAAPHLGAPAQPLVGLDHPVILAAVDWLEASLAIGEVDRAASAPAPASIPASPWAAVAA